VTDEGVADLSALFLALIIAFSRLYLMVHFPSDVFAGMILGIAFGFMAHKIINNIYEKKKLQ